MLHKHLLRLRVCTTIFGMVIAGGCQTCKTIETVDATYAARIVVVGEVGQPGEFPIVTEATTLTQALRLCGGIVRPGMRSGGQIVVGTQSASPTVLAEIEALDRRLKQKPLGNSAIERVSFSSVQQQATAGGISAAPSTAQGATAVAPLQAEQLVIEEGPQETLLIGIQRRGTDDIFYFPERLVAASPDLIGRIRLFHGDTVSVVPWVRTGLKTELFSLANYNPSANYPYYVSGLVGTPVERRVLGASKLDDAAVQDIGDAVEIQLANLRRVAISGQLTSEELGHLKQLAADSLGIDLTGQIGADEWKAAIDKLSKLEVGKDKGVALLETKAAEMRNVITAYNKFATSQPSVDLLEGATVILLTRQSLDRTLREHFVHSLQGDDGLSDAWKESIAPLDHFQYTTLSRVPVVMSHLLAPALSSRPIEVVSGPHTATKQSVERRHGVGVDTEAVCGVLMMPFDVADRSVKHAWSRIHPSSTRRADVTLPPEAFVIDPTLQDLQLQEQSHHDRKMEVLQDTVGGYGN